MGRIAGKDFSKVLTKRNLIRWYLRFKTSQLDIANSIGCTKALVGKYMQKFHIPVRDRRTYTILGMGVSYKRCHQKIRRVE